MCDMGCEVTGCEATSTVTEYHQQGCEAIKVILLSNINYVHCNTILMPFSLCRLRSNESGNKAMKAITHVSATLRTLLIASTNFSVLVTYWIWLVLILAIFE